MERTTVRLPEGLLDLASKKAAAEKTTLTALIERGLREVVYAKPAPAKRRKATLPVSKAKGGLRPGIDLTRTSEVLGRLDEELFRTGGLEKLR